MIPKQRTAVLLFFIAGSLLAGAVALRWSVESTSQEVEALREHARLLAGIEAFVEAGGLSDAIPLKTAPSVPHSPSDMILQLKLDEEDFLSKAQEQGIHLSETFSNPFAPYVYDSKRITPTSNPRIQRARLGYLSVMQALLEAQPLLIESVVVDENRPDCDHFRLCFRGKTEHLRRFIESLGCQEAPLEISELQVRPHQHAQSVFLLGIDQAI